MHDWGEIVGGFIVALFLMAGGPLLVGWVNLLGG
jgi:hypothetical protein